MHPNSFSPNTSRFLPKHQAMPLYGHKQSEVLNILISQGLTQVDVENISPCYNLHLRNVPLK